MEDDELILAHAALEGNLEEVKRLVGVTSEHERSVGLAWAAKHGHHNVVEFLIPYSDPTNCGSVAFRFAASWGHIECLRLLLPVSEPKYYNSSVISAAMQGHAECMSLLIGASDPQDCHSEALYEACFYKRQNCIDILIPLSDCYSVLQKLEHKIQKFDEKNYTEAFDLLKERMVYFENTLITSQLSVATTQRLNRKI